MNLNLLLFFATLCLACVSCFHLRDQSNAEKMAEVAEQLIRNIKRHIREIILELQEDFDESKHKQLADFRQKKFEFESRIEHEKIKSHHEGSNIIECIADAKENLRNISSEAVHACDMFDAPLGLNAVSKFMSQELASVRSAVIKCGNATPGPDHYEQCVAAEVKAAIDAAEHWKTEFTNDLENVDIKKYKRCYRNKVQVMKDEVDVSELKFIGCLEKHKM